MDSRKLVVLCWCLCWVGGVICCGSPLPTTSVAPVSVRRPRLDPGLRLWLQAVQQNRSLATDLHRSLQSLTVSPLYVGAALLQSQNPALVLPQQQLRWATLLLPRTRWRLRSTELELRVLLDYRGDPAQLKRWEMDVTARVGTVMAGWLPLRHLAALQQAPALWAAELSRPLRPHLNVSASMVQAPAARLQYGLDGRDVIVGIIDTGVDYRHPAFRHPDGTTRIISILDFSLISPITKTLPRVFNQEQINEALKTDTPLGHEDKLGHGTHITGIACGNGGMPGQTSPNYLGIAPRADLIVVKGLRKDSREFDSADVLQGIAFIHTLARRANKPYVINLSLGGQQGGHDGYSLLERALATFSGKGKSGQVLVASAGNEGQAQIHARGWLGQEQSLTLLLKVPGTSEQKGSTRITIELWYPEDGKFSLTIQPPGEAAIGPFGPDNYPQKIQETPHSLIALTLHKHSQPIPSRSVSILLSSRDNQPFPLGDWQFRLQGQTRRFDAWITESSLPNGMFARWGNYHTQEMLIGIPASSDAVITVGSFNSRSGWLNAEGHVQQRAFAVGALSDFSSPGPTRDGRPKPEVTAPGLFVAAPISGFALPDPSSQVADGPYHVSQGTSQAAPHVTGGVALLLQAFPKLDTEMIRHLLMRSATTDSHTGEAATYQKGWGFGKLNLLTAMQTQTAGSDQPADPKRSTLGLLLEELPADGQSQTYIYIVPKDREGIPINRSLAITVELEAGTVSVVETISPGLYRAMVTAPTSPTTAKITARVDGIALETTRTIHFLSAERPPSHVGCQCQSASPPGALSLWLVFGFLGLLMWQRIRRTYQLLHNPW